MSQDLFLQDSQGFRLPVYLLLDCSGSMQGEPIKAVNDGLFIIYDELIKNARALESAYLSVITFANQAKVVTPLGSIAQYQPQALQAYGQTAMGAALSLLVSSIEQDVLAHTAQQHGDYRPLVFLLSDGNPTDDYKSGIQRIRTLRGNKQPEIIALACEGGAQGVDTVMLHELTPHFSIMQKTSGDKIRQYFRWISGTIIQVSQPTSISANKVSLNPPTDMPGEINYTYTELE